MGGHRRPDVDIKRADGYRCCSHCKTWLPPEDFYLWCSGFRWEGFTCHRICYPHSKCKVCSRAGRRKPLKNNSTCVQSETSVQA